MPLHLSRDEKKLLAAVRGWQSLYGRTTDELVQALLTVAAAALRGYEPQYPPPPKTKD